MTSSLPGGWQLEQRISPIDINGVFFISDEIGYVCGDHGQIAKSSDGGLNWSTLTDEDEITSLHLDQIYFLDENYGWVIDEDSPNGFYTQDGGETWSPFAIPLGSYIYQIHFTAPNYGIALAGTNQTTQIVYTSDSAKTWQSISGSFDVQGQLFFFDSMVYGVGKDNQLYRANIPIDIWHVVALPFEVSWNSRLYKVGTNTLFIISADNTLMKSEDNGKTWIELTSALAHRSHIAHLNSTDGFIFTRNNTICFGDLVFPKSYNYFSIKGNQAIKMDEINPRCIKLRNYYRINDHNGMMFDNRRILHFHKN